MLTEDEKTIVKADDFSNEKNKDILWKAFGIVLPTELIQEDDAIEDYFIAHKFSREGMHEYFDYKRQFLLDYKKKTLREFFSVAGIIAGLLFQAASSTLLIRIVADAILAFLAGCLLYNSVEKEKLSEKYNTLNEHLGLTFVKKR